MKTEKDLLEEARRLLGMAANLLTQAHRDTHILTDEEFSDVLETYIYATANWHTQLRNINKGLSNGH